MPTLFLSLIVAVDAELKESVVSALSHREATLTIYESASYTHRPVQGKAEENRSGDPKVSISLQEFDLKRSRHQDNDLSLRLPRRT